MKKILECRDCYYVTMYFPGDMWYQYPGYNEWVSSSGCVSPSFCPLKKEENKEKYETMIKWAEECRKED